MRGNRRSYMCCLDCFNIGVATRMVRITRADEDDTWYYLCRDCGQTYAFDISRNLIERGWPDHVDAAAIKMGVLASDGTIVQPV